MATAANARQLKMAKSAATRAKPAQTQAADESPGHNEPKTLVVSADLREIRTDIRYMRKWMYALTAGMVIIAGGIIWTDDRTDTKIAASEARLTTKIEALDQRTTAKIEALDQRLTTKIEALDQRMTARMDRINDRIDRLEDRMDRQDAKLDKILVILAQNSNAGQPPAPQPSPSP